MEKTANDRVNDQQIHEFLRNMPGWIYTSTNASIERTFVRKNFLDAVAFIEQIAPIAERMDHHPDILLSGYKNVKVMLSTHSAGGVTQNDFVLARVIDQLPA
ncbi:MAG TPA: 4a-hydroxytetrahydrobiopterin dehydratase [Candidatus Kapabacteria bacterium]|nr:4a-hydroxytetrahydrobiopterin dehydratase [Candidatus Kapabacteria bacterium]